MNNRKHYAAGITAFVIWGFFSIPLRALIANSPGEILYFRILFSLIILSFIVVTFRAGELRKDLLLFKSLPRKDRNKVTALTLVGGVLLTINWLTFIYIVNEINVKTASFSYLICPVITAILGVVLIHEKLNRSQWVAVGLCGVSCIMMGLSSRLELGYSVLTAFTYALYLITQRKNQGFDRLVMLGVQVLFSFIILTILSPVLISEVPVSANFYITIFIIAAVFTVLPLFLNLFALNRINSATIGILMYVNPIINFAVAFFIFDEAITSLQLFGYSIILAGLILFNYGNFRRMHASFSETRV
jgi:chloramphenicol-sensitive protein RarD